MEKVAEYSDLIFKLKYFCIDGLIDETILDVKDFKIEYCISDRKFKHVEQDILFHYLFLNVIKLIRNSVIEKGFKPVLYVSKNKAETDVFDVNIALQIKKLKKLLPIPLIIPLDEAEVFYGAYGRIKEVNSKILNFYSKKKVKIKEVKKYLDNKGFNTLSNTLSSIVDLKGFYY